MLLNTSLLRERFTITRQASSDDEPIVALGNRILLPLVSVNGEIRERFVIRAHSMHMALRVAAAITREFYRTGPLVNRQIPFKWADMWYEITKDFERIYVPETWVSVYTNGRTVFSEGDHHPFLDVIEQCDVKNRAEYDRAITIAEDVFKQAGKTVHIDHDINIALVIGVMEEKTRCGLILRVPGRAATFNFQMEISGEGNGTPPRPHEGLALAADYLEAIQLAVTTGFTQSLLDEGLLRDTSPRAKKAKAAYRRIGRLNQSVQIFEKSYAIRYRPEKPDFMDILNNAKQFEEVARI